MQAVGVATKSVQEVEDGQRPEPQHEAMRPTVENLCKDQKLPPAPIEDKPISPVNMLNDTRITSSSSDTSKHVGGNGDAEMELPLRSRGGYNLDFLEEVGAEAVNLCPTSPPVVKERRRSVGVVQQNPEKASGCEESSFGDIHLKRSPRARNKDDLTGDISQSSIDQPLSSKGYNIDLLTAEGLNAEDLDPNMVGKKGGLQNSPPTGVSQTKGRKLAWMRKKA